MLDKLVAMLMVVFMVVTWIGYVVKTDNVFIAMIAICLGLLGKWYLANKEV